MCQLRARLGGDGERAIEDCDSAVVWDSHPCRAVVVSIAEHAVDGPVIGQPFERVSPVGIKFDTRADDEVLDGARCKQVASAAKRSGARANVHSDAREIVPNDFALAGVEPGADLDVHLPEALDQLAPAANRPRGTVEAGE